MVNTLWIVDLEGQIDTPRGSTIYMETINGQNCVDQRSWGGRGGGSTINMERILSPVSM